MFFSLIILIILISPGLLKQLKLKENLNNNNIVKQKIKVLNKRKYC